jgi:CRP-like cAMP-binding protein
MSGLDWEILSGLPPEEADQFLSLGSTVPFPDRAVLFRMGEEATNLFFVRKGTVRLTLPLTVGGSSSHTTIGERGVGQLVGWSAIVPPHIYTLEASAAAEVECISLPRADVLDLLNAHHALGYRVFKNLARILGHQLQLSQTLWVRELQRGLRTAYPEPQPKF